MKKVCAIFNPNAGTACEPDVLAAALAPLGAITLLPTSEAKGAQQLAAQAVSDGFDLVVAAGGDGTINEVVNGLASDWERACLAVVPLGTGNDFARTIAIPTDLAAAVAALQEERIETIDVVQATSKDRIAYFINVSAGGFSGLVDEQLTDELKASWGPFAYLLAAAGALPSLTDYYMTLQFDDHEPQLLQAYNIVVANGRFVAGGLPVAPHAVLDDGLFDVIVVPVLPATKIGLLAPQFFLGRHINSDELIVRQARRFKLDAKPGMWFNVDGELVGNDPVEFTVLPRRLRVLVGADYQREPSP